MAVSAVRARVVGRGRSASPRVRAAIVASLLGCVGACAGDERARGSRALDASSGDGSSGSSAGGASGSAPGGAAGDAGVSGAAGKAGTAGEAGAGGVAGAGGARDASAGQAGFGGGNAGRDAGAAGAAGADPDAGADATADAADDAPDLCAGVVCTALDACHVAGTCDPTTGLCDDPPASDGTPCPCGACTAGACGLRQLGPTALSGVVGTPLPVSLAVDGARAYFGDSYAGFAGRAGIGAMPVGGGAVTTLAGGFTGYPDVAASGGLVYFTRGTEVWSVPGDASAAATLLYGGSEAFYAISTDGAELFLSSAGDVWSLSLTGGAPTRLTSGEAGPGRVVARSSTLYWINSGDRTLRTLPASGGTPSTVLTFAEAPGDLSVDATTAYVTQPTTGTVLAAPLAGGGPTVVATGQDDPRSVLVYGGSVYFTNYATGTFGALRAVDVGGGSLRTAPGPVPFAPFALRHDGTCLYLLSAGNGAVWSTPPF